MTLVRFEHNQITSLLFRDQTNRLLCSMAKGTNQISRTDCDLELTIACCLGGPVLGAVVILDSITRLAAVRLTTILRS